MFEKFEKFVRQSQPRRSAEEVDSICARCYKNRAGSSRSHVYLALAAASADSD